MLRIASMKAVFILSLLAMISGCSNLTTSESTINTWVTKFGETAKMNAGAQNVESDAFFLVKFGAQLTGDVFIVKGSRADRTLTTFDAATCDIANEVPSNTFSCSTSACTIEPVSFFHPSTDYSICVLPFRLKDLNYPGFTLSFTTASGTLAGDGCTDPSIVVKPFITHLPFDLGTVGKIGKFRSCTSQGSLPATTEPASAHTHVIYGLSSQVGCKEGIPVYAPFDGVIADISTTPQSGPCDPAIGSDGYIMLYPDGAYRYQFYLNNVIPAAGLKEGDAVTAGQQLGTVTLISTDRYWEIGVRPYSVATGESEMCNIGLFFNDAVAAQLNQHGINASALSFTKAYREAHPCEIAPSINTFSGAPDGDNNYVVPTP